MRKNSKVGKILERVAGIEPASLAWKAKVLPLHNARSARWWLSHATFWVKHKADQVPALQVRWDADLTTKSAVYDLLNGRCPASPCTRKSDKKTTETAIRIGRLCQNSNRTFASARHHDHNRSQANHALTIKLDQPDEAVQKRSKRDAGIAVIAPHNQTDQMRQTLSWFKPKLVPISMTTDSHWHSDPSVLCDACCAT